MPDSPSKPAWKLERYQSLLRLLACQLHLDPRLQSRFDASDVVSETMVRAVAALDKFAGTTEAEFVRWLRTILNNAFIDMVRREKAEGRTPSREMSLDALVADSSARFDHYLAVGQSSPSEQVEREEFLLRFANAVENLSAEQRDAVLLRDLYELPVKVIAERLGQTEKAIHGLILADPEKELCLT